MKSSPTDQEYDVVALDALRPHPKNPRRGNVESIAESVSVNGFYGAVVAQRSTGYILAGNHRWKAAASAGMSSIPVIWLDCDDAAAHRILLVDNRTNDVAGYDNTALAEVLSQLALTDAALAGTGYDAADLDELVTGLVLPGADDWGNAMGKVGAEEKAHRAITFFLDGGQFELASAALAKAKSVIKGSEDGNHNAAALALICEGYLQ